MRSILVDLFPVVKDYYEFRGLVYPDKTKATGFLATEIGELHNALTKLEPGWVRNNELSSDEAMIKIADELGDCLMMLCVSCAVSGVDFELQSNSIISDAEERNISLRIATFGKLGYTLFEQAELKAPVSVSIHLVGTHLFDLASYLGLDPVQCMFTKFTRKRLEIEAKRAAKQQEVADQTINEWLAANKKDLA